MIAIEKAKDLSFKKLWMETDCLLVVKAFSNTCLVPWTIRSRWLRCIAHTRSIEFLITRVYREVNFCADLLANLGLYIGRFCWFQLVHFVIVQYYLLNKVGTPRLRLCS